MKFLPKTPLFWSRKGHPLSLLLAPLGALYGGIVRLRFALARPYRSKLPVICVGNFTMGGGGKTPLCMQIARLLLQNGHQPVFLTRGYGGETTGPHLLDVHDTALTVGDEPLILLQTAPVVVSADRAKGARFIEKLAADVIIMDDGFQNPGLFKDLSLVVVDEVSGIGNGRVFPAGPLRAGLSFQLPQTDILMISGPAPPHGSATQELEQSFSREIFRGELVAKGDVDWLDGARVAAVTGIARPDKFYATLQQLGAKLERKFDYPDHYMFGEQDAQNLLDLKQAEDVEIVMTQKDWVRLPQSGVLGRLRQQARVLEVELQVSKSEELAKRLELFFH